MQPLHAKGLFAVFLQFTFINQIFTQTFFLWPDKKKDSEVVKVCESFGTKPYPVTTNDELTSIMSAMQATKSIDGNPWYVNTNLKKSSHFVTSGGSKGCPVLNQSAVTSNLQYSLQSGTLQASFTGQTFNLLECSVNVTLLTSSGEIVDADGLTATVIVCTVEGSLLPDMFPSLGTTLANLPTYCNALGTSVKYIQTNSDVTNVRKLISIGFSHCIWIGGIKTETFGSRPIGCTVYDTYALISPHVAFPDGTHLQMTSPYPNFDQCNATEVLYCLEYDSLEDSPAGSTNGGLCAIQTSAGSSE